MSTAVRNNCPLCNNPDDDDDMVACDQCDTWHHFRCAGVNHSIADRSWRCNKCHLQILPALSKSSRRSTSEAQAELQLKRLEEERAMHAKHLAEDLAIKQAKLAQQEDALKLQREIDQHYIEQRYAVLQSTLEENDNRSNRSLRSQQSSRSKVKDWMEKQQEQAAGTESEATLPAGTTSFAATQGKPTNATIAVAVQSTVPFIPVPISSVGLSNTPKRPFTTVGGNSQMLPTTLVSTAVLTGTERNQNVLTVQEVPCTLPLMNPAYATRAVVEQPISAVRQLTSGMSYRPYTVTNTTFTGALVARPVPSVQAATGIIPISSSSNAYVGAATRPVPSVQAASSIIPIPSSSNAYVGAATRPVPNLEYDPNVHALHQSSGGKTLENILEQINYRVGDLVIGNRLAETPNMQSLPPRFRSLPPSTRDPGVFQSNAAEQHFLHSTPHPNVNLIATPHPRRIETNIPSLGVPDISQSIPEPAISSSLAVAGPSQQQLAARQVVSKELPVFTGNPLEWPLFINSYENSTALCGFSLAENMMRLQRSLKGNALEAVRCNLLMPDAVPRVMATLKMLYGRPEIIVNSLLAKVRSTPPPRADRLETLITYGLVVQNLCSQLIASGQIAHLGNPSLLQELVEKLPASIKMDWARYKRRVLRPDITTFENYMSSIIEEASEVSLFVEPERGNKETKRPPSRDKAFVNAHGLEGNGKVSSENSSGRAVQDQPKQKSCPICQQIGHKVKDCGKFKAQNLHERWRLVEDQQLCRRCLVRHGKWPCHTTYPCGVDGCDARHHQLLHPGKSNEVKRSVEITNPVVKTNLASTSGTVSTHRQVVNSILFRVIPVTLYGPNSSIKTFAFLDEGSSLTLLDKDIAKELGLNGEVSSLCLNWTSDVSRIEPSSERLTVEIAGGNGTTKYTMSNVRTVDGLKLPAQSLVYEDLVGSFPYLGGLPIESYRDANPRILIGVEHSKLSVALKKREGRGDEPIATRCRLGWTIHGRIGSGNQDAAYFNHHVCDCSTDRELHGIVERFFAIDAVLSTVPTIETEDDRRARRILTETTVRVDGGFETGLLWKYDYIEFPRSYSMAEQRLKCLERRMKSNPALRENLVRQLREYQKKGYAHKATETELLAADPTRVWYLPLGAVINPKKPGKVRVIWDAAAKVNGISLNTMLLKGPDMLTSLPAVLSRYRQRQVAISADIKEMFHQLRIRESDKQSQRFLWREDPSHAPEVFVMDRATFGSTCSPCSSQYVKNRNAVEYAEEFPDAAEAIIDNHYVDDYLDSRDTEDEAVRIAREVKFVHAKGGFEIRNWLSNSTNVLAQLGEMKHSTVKRFVFDKSEEESGERVLGMIWLPHEDVFSFPVTFGESLKTLLIDSIVPTKRQILKVVMSIFDPMGFLTTFLIHGKLIIQELWRAGVGWDDPIPERVHVQWKRWAAQFPELPKLRIPRCYFPNYHPESYKTLQMHVFVDASETAFACAVYFRIEDRGVVRCALVASKSKVAPLKALTIPRLELQAAALGCRLAANVEKNHSLAIAQRFFWSDSTTVLSWIRCMEPRRYTPFVTFRVSDILAQSTVDEWRWVPTAENVADEATKWGKGPNFCANDRWFRGPEFLYKPESQWPTLGSHAVDTSEELRSRYVSHHLEQRSLVDIRRFSKWERLLRTVAYTYKFVANCRRKLRAEANNDCASLLHPEYILKAERYIWRVAQHECFSGDILVLAHNRNVPQHLHKKLDSTSSIRKASPFLDEYGVIRMEGRITEAPYVPYDAKFPVILPKTHVVTKLLLDWYHRKYGHGYGETVVNEVKQRFHIPRLRTTVRTVRGTCSWCKIYRASPSVPRMAPLPAARLTAYVKPFTYVGLDYFGPIFIRAGRTNQKRWVALFTCLTVRAVHLEVVYSLTTEACKLAVRRFIARRGSPLEIYSDMGTNFIGASRDLEKEIQQAILGVASTFTNTNTRWRFNPPVSPHMGGAWERMVRAVKMAIFALPMDKRPSDESLITLLAEAEFIINSRPLTFVPLEAADEEALTPNHFLLLSSNGISQPSTMPVDAKSTLRNNWGHVQHLTDLFWKRWIREYLPVITRRTKWFDETRPVQVEELVVIVDDNVRNGWIRGRVVKVLPGPDGRIRMADVQTTTGILRRPVAKLAVLDVR
ncbi:uncharacterized protein LOC131679946 [Topomyia yanbarensis]|uniref:uncharacterized protein LOC131679946 n=1 Tax=Topomyia yanbarensis TaxID=2498891 RepID=UPI00273B6C93|nr:uncharacterized protein LOC131679946 [Topomyia yanbarensis]